MPRKAALRVVIDMWPFKKEIPYVDIYKDSVRHSDGVTVRDHRNERPWEAFDLDKIKKDTQDKVFVMSGATIISVPPPDTIESLINRLIELGEPKPEVVITGEKRADGIEGYSAIIDKSHVFAKKDHWINDVVRVVGYELCSEKYKYSMCGFVYESSFKTLADCEKAIISILKDRLSRVVTETTTITY